MEKQLTNAALMALKTDDELLAGLATFIGRKFRTVYNWLHNYAEPRHDFLTTPAAVLYLEEKLQKPVTEEKQKAPATAGAQA